MCSVIVNGIWTRVLVLCVWWFIFARNSIHHLLLGPFLDAAELIEPMAFIRLHPIVNGLHLSTCSLYQLCCPASRRSQRLACAIHRDAWIPPAARSYPCNHIADRPLQVFAEKADDLSTSRLRDRIEDISNRRRSSHVVVICPYRNVCQRGTFNIQSELARSGGRCFRICEVICFFGLLPGARYDALLEKLPLHRIASQMKWLM